MLKTHQNAITESIMFLEQPRQHFLPRSRPPRINLAKQDNTTVYICVHVICMVNILGRKSAKTKCLPTSFAHEELDSLL